MDPVWCTANAVFFAFLVDKVRIIHTKYGSTIRTAKNRLISFPVIFPVPRRKIIKISKKISRNYESNGLFLDTIKSPFFLRGRVYFPHFIVPFWHALGHYNSNNIRNISYHILHIFSGPFLVHPNRKIRFQICFSRRIPGKIVPVRGYVV